MHSIANADFARGWINIDICRLITFVEDRVGHALRYAVDVTKMNDKLNWQPAETFETGIGKTVEWYLK